MSNPEKVKGKFIAFRDVIIHKIAKKASTHGVLLVSTLLIAVVMIVTFLNRCPSQSQYSIIRIITATGLTGYMAVLPSLLKIRFNNSIRLGGGLIIFIIVYGWNPAFALTTDDCFEQMHLTGTVLLGHEPLAGAIVKFPQLNETDITNSQGVFNIPFNKLLVGTSAELQIEYKHLAKEVTVPELANDLKLKIQIPDTVTQLTDSLALGTIKEYVKFNNEQTQLEAQTLIRSRRGERISSTTLQQHITIWEKLSGGATNDLLFSNGFWKLNTQKALNEAGLDESQWNVSSHGSFTEPAAYLLQWEHEIRKGQNQSAIKLEFIIVEKAPTEVELLGARRRRTKTSYHLRIRHSQSIRLAHLTLEYSEATDWKKRSKIRLHGNLQVEEYLLEFKRLEWRVTNSTRPEKIS